METTTTTISSQVPTTVMKAHIVENYCDTPDFILKQDEPIPSLLTETQLLVRIKAIGINPADYKTRNGCAKLLYPVKFPAVLGKDGSGQVVRTGSKVQKFKEGDFVVGCYSGNRNGTFAEYAVFEESECTLKPKELSFVQASAFPTAGLTMIEAFKTHPMIAPIIERESQNIMQREESSSSSSQPESDSELKPNFNILLIGASGGIGCMSIMLIKTFLARFLNIKLFAVCSGKNEKTVSELGANVVLDYMKTSAKNGPQTIHENSSELPSVCQVLRKDHGIEFVDFVLDCYGGYYYYDDVCRHLTCHDASFNRRTIFTTVNPPGIDTLNFTNLLKMAYLMLSTKVKALISNSYPVFNLATFDVTQERYFKLLLEQVAISKIQESHVMAEKLPLSIFKFEQIKEAHHVIESQHAVGKIVIDMDLQ
ncbi:hypothetical protein C9374_012621 [Naegleria lovaniensis]|uniref:Enoyl reductase (ER) domain-containing protein n=1 Tax=Naegleria lovaniensis TaxID=51637 RepID=A0AA88GXH1_NAELO|nr:uncharacterized protein C9374_012621 [Naegleria lovaniensis]KAG2392369.1 hypothetical protein C9374_012621 [Naegleria lovaniensis]